MVMQIERLLVPALVAVLILLPVAALSMQAKVEGYVASRAKRYLG